MPNIAGGELLILAILGFLAISAFAVAVLVLLARRPPPQVVVVVREPDSGASGSGGEG
jgi:hypothetical protein